MVMPNKPKYLQMPFLEPVADKPRRSPSWLVAATLLVGLTFGSGVVGGVVWFTAVRTAWVLGEWFPLAR